MTDDLWHIPPPNDEWNSSPPAATHTMSLVRAHHSHRATRAAVCISSFFFIFIFGNQLERELTQWRRRSRPGEFSLPTQAILPRKGLISVCVIPLLMRVTFFPPATGSCSAKAAWKRQSVTELRTTEAAMRRRAEAKKEELRQYVGLRYRDLLRSTDAIMAMKRLSESVSGRIGEMLGSLSDLNARKRRAGGEAVPTPAGLKVRGGQGRWEDTVGRMCRAPERLQGLVNEQRFTAACAEYIAFRSEYRFIVSQLGKAAAEEAAAADRMESKPELAHAGVNSNRKDGTPATARRRLLLFAMQNSDSLGRFPTALKRKCEGQLLEPACDPSAAADALLALAALAGASRRDAAAPLATIETPVDPGMTGPQLLKLFLTTRLRLLRGVTTACTRVGTSKSGRTAPEASRNALVMRCLRDAASVITATLNCVSSVFCGSSRRGGDASSGSPLDAIASFGRGRAKQASAAALRGVTLPQASYTSTRTREWLCEVRAAMSPALPTILSFLSGSASVADARDAVLGVLDPVSGGKTPWHRAFQSLIKTPLSTEGGDDGSKGTVGAAAAIWDWLFADAFRERCKSAIAGEFLKFDISAVVDAAVEAAFRASPAPVLSVTIARTKRKVGSEFAERLGSVFGGLGQLLQVTHPDILSLVQLADFTLKPSIQSECASAVSRVVHGMRKRLVSLDKESLALSPREYGQSADRAAILAGICQALAGYDGFIEAAREKLGKQNKEAKAPSQDRFPYVAQTLLATTPVGRRTLLAAALTGVRVWSRHLAGVLSSDLTKDLSAFYGRQAGQDAGGKGPKTVQEPRLAGAWERISLGPGQSDTALMPVSASPPICKLIFSACSEVYRVSGQAPDAALVMCVKIDLATQAVAAIRAFVDAAKSGAGLDADCWKQLLFDTAFLLQVLRFPRETPAVSKAASRVPFDGAYVLRETATEAKACIAGVAQLVRAIEVEMDPVNLRAERQRLRSSARTAVRRSAILFGPFGPFAPEAKESKGAVNTAVGSVSSKSGRADAQKVVTLMSLAPPTDHIPLLPASLYPKRVVPRGGIAVPAQRSAVVMPAEKNVKIDHLEMVVSSAVAQRYRVAEAAIRGGTNAA